MSRVYNDSNFTCSDADLTYDESTISYDQIDVNYFGTLTVAKDGADSVSSTSVGAGIIFKPRAGVANALGMSIVSGL